jgi:hypothetical protein
MELTHEQRDEQRDLEQRQVLAAAREARSAGASRTIAAHRRRTHACTHARSALVLPVRACETSADATCG